MLIGLLSACDTIRPKPITDAVPSWDGTAQNSGFIGWTTNGSAIITPYARARYNALAVKYSSRFPVPIAPDAGISGPTATNTYILTPDYLVKFATMNRWHKTLTPDS